MIKRLNTRNSLVMLAFGMSTLLTLAGCSQAPPVNPNAANDPAGLGTPQERLKLLQANTQMPEQLKARKMKILQDEINGNPTTPGKH